MNSSLGLYPTTKEKFVFDENGKPLNEKLSALETKLSNVLQALQYATFTQDVSGILSDL